MADEDTTTQLGKEGDHQLLKLVLRCFHVADVERMEITPRDGSSKVCMLPAVVEAKDMAEIIGDFEFFATEREGDQYRPLLRALTNRFLSPQYTALAINHLCGRGTPAALRLWGIYIHPMLRVTACKVPAGVRCAIVLRIICEQSPTKTDKVGTEDITLQAMTWLFSHKFELEDEIDLFLGSLYHAGLLSTTFQADTSKCPELRVGPLSFPTYDSRLVAAYEQFRLRKLDEPEAKKQRTA